MASWSLNLVPTSLCRILKYGPWLVKGIHGDLVLGEEAGGYPRGGGLKLHASSALFRV